MVFSPYAVLPLNSRAELCNRVSDGLGPSGSQGGDGVRIRTLSAVSLDRQIASDGATWLDRQIITEDRSGIRDSGFGREVNKAIGRRARRLVEMGLATAKDGNVRVPVDTVATLERREVERVGHQMARERGLTYMPANA